MSNGAAILVVDDEPQIRRVLRTTLCAQGYTVLEARARDEALALLLQRRPDLVLLDMNLPGADGISICRDMRRSSDVPILMVTVRDAERDKVEALDAGADDYIVKPFGTPELLARVRVALRRKPGPGEAPAPIRSRQIEVDFDRRNVLVRGEPVHLTPKEFDLLRELAAAPGRPVAHRRLLQAVWGPDYGGETEYLRVAINQLRKKIEARPSEPRIIVTEPWIGYRFVPPEE